MFRVLLAAVLTAISLQATSFVSTTCTIGSVVISPCAGAGGPNYSLEADAQATFTPGINFQDSSLFAMTGAAANGGVIGSNNEATVIAIAQEIVDANSTGSPRSGFIEFEININYSHSGGPEEILSDGTHQYEFFFDGTGPVRPTSCNIDFCNWSGTLAFELGVGFEAAVLAESGASTRFGGGQEGDGRLAFTLLEADQTTVVPFSLIPEPSSSLLLLVGITVPTLAFFRSRGRRAL